MGIVRLVPPFLWPVGALLVACGGAPREPVAPSEAEASTDSTVEEPSPSAPATAPEARESDGPSALPNACDPRDTEYCTAPPRWVKKLCADVHPSVALHLFHPSSPFTHGYLTRKTKATNASGGVTSGDEWLRFDEEVVLLVHRGASSSGIQVSGAEGGFDAMRWDGSCVTLDSTEVTTRKPPEPKFGRIDWRFLDDETQEALKKDERIREAFVARKKECKGAHSGDVSKACVQKDEALIRSIVEAVKAGRVSLPVPAKRP